MHFARSHKDGRLASAQRCILHRLHNGNMAVTTTSASYAYALNNLIQPDNTAIPAEWKSVGQTAIVLYRGTGLGSQPLQASVWKTKIETLTPDAEVEVKPTDPVPANNEAQTLQVQLLALYGDTVPPQSGTATSASSTTSSTTPITSTQSEPPSGSSSTGTITPTPSKSLEPAHNARLPDGAVAGIAIATAIAGAALAATVLFFLFFKRNRQRRDHPSDMAARQKQSGSGGAGNNGRGLSDDGVAGGLGKGARTSGLDYILPQPLDDGNIKAAVSDFFKRIEDHVDSRFYPDVPASGEKGPTETSNELALLAVQPDLDVSVLLSESHTRFQVLKALVCAETLAAIDFEGTSARSLLPSVVTAFLSKISPNLQDNHRECLHSWSERVGAALLTAK